MGPAHPVMLAGFWIDQTEVTNSMYAFCVKDGRCRQPEETTLHGNLIYSGVPEFEKYPMRYVTWEDAQDYCA
jgi:eukaryotic-like serine/threonine-protein kinase